MSTPRVLGDLGDHPAQVQIHHAALRGERLIAALDDLQERVVGLGVRLRPEVLEGGALERLERGPTGELVDTARGRPGEALEVVGQGLLDLVLDVHLLEQGVDQEGVQRPLDSLFASSSVLVSVQVFVSRICRLAQTAKTAKKAMTLARTMIAIDVRLKRGCSGIAGSFAALSDVRRPLAGPRGPRDFGLARQQSLLEAL
jgi:hypothetical protein